MSVRRADDFIADVGRQFDWYLDEAGWEVANRYLDAVEALGSLRRSRFSGEQPTPGLLLSGGDFDHAVNEMGGNVARHSFYRERAKLWLTRLRSQRGLGLGLSLVKAMVEAHGGKVTLSSQVN